MRESPSSFVRYIRSAPLVVAVAALWVASTVFAQSSDLTTEPPPAPYVNASSILELPDFIPGAGALYIDPANAPVGPWLAYGSDGSLVEVLFMVPLSQMQDATNWDDLATGFLDQLGVTIDHVDISFNGGHPGMAEPHYHFRLVVVDAQTQQSLLNP